jgi:muramoyltetrapeptide carboxypeptidase
MVSPPFLVPGDNIGLVAPGRKVSAQDVREAQKIFESWEWNIIPAQNLHSNRHNYLAGSDVERTSDFQQMIDDPDIKAIICARGGYGTTRILDDLDFSSLVKNPKWIVGFSDVTALHLKLINLGIYSVHGTMPILFSKPESKTSIENLRSILLGQSVPISAQPNKHNRYGMATAPVIGGNLSLIVDAIGTGNDLDTAGKILVLEEIDEYMYKVDRMLIHLKRARKLDNLAGLVIGYMTDIKEPEISFGEVVEKVITSKVADKTFPVAFNFPIGHENPNYPWVHGATMTLTVNDMGAQLLSRY